VGYNLNSATASDALTPHIQQIYLVLYLNTAFKPTLFGKKRYWLVYNVQLQMCAIYKVLVLVVFILSIHDIMNICNKTKISTSCDISWSCDILSFYHLLCRSGDRILVGARFCTHVQTGPEVHPASCTMGTGSFPGVKRPGCGADHSPPSSAEVKKE
jgi:hypothetical protein